MDQAITAKKAVEMRNAIEEALVGRISETLDILDAHVADSFRQPDHASYIAEQDRIDNFFKADRLKFEDGTPADRYERWLSPWVWSTRTCQPFPGRNRFVRKLDGGLELWFRIEFAFRGFAGYTVYDPSASSLIRFRDIPAHVADGLFDHFGIASDDVADNCWWVINEYLPDGPEATSPNFRMMDDLSLRLLDDAAFGEFIGKSKELIDKLIRLA